MRKPILRVALFCTVLLLFESPAWSQSAKFKGYMFGDAYYLAQHDDKEIEGSNGMWFRRIYLTFDFTLNESWSARIRFEQGSPGDFRSKTKLSPTDKDAYVRWKNDRHQLTLGLQESPTWNLIEKFWGYRSVEKTLLDLQRIASSRDIGFAAKGSLDPAKKFRYNVMLANGNGTSSESDKGKKIYSSLGFYPTEALTLEVYGDYDDRPGENNRYTFQGFAGFQQDWGRIGLQYFHQTRAVEEGQDLELRGLSLFGAAKINDKLSGYARFDKMFDANPEAGKISYVPFFDTGKSNMVIAGLDYKVHEQVHFMPNLQVVYYDSIDGVQKPGTTVIPRLTFWVIFPSSS